MYFYVMKKLVLLINLKGYSGQWLLILFLKVVILKEIIAISRFLAKKKKRGRAGNQGWDSNCILKTALLNTLCYPFLMQKLGLLWCLETLGHLTKIFLGEVTETLALLCLQEEAPSTKPKSRAHWRLQRGHGTPQPGEVFQGWLVLTKSSFAKKSLFLILFRNNLLGFSSNCHKCQITIVQTDGDLLWQFLVTQLFNLPRETDWKCLFISFHLLTTHPTPTHIAPKKRENDP